MGTIYKGGVIVPVIQTLLLTVLALSIERYFALRSAFGRGSLVKFVSNIKDALSVGDLRKAQEVCETAWFCSKRRYFYIAEVRRNGE